MESERHELLIYPNPANTYVHISGLGDKKYNYNLYDLGGRQVAYGKVQERTVVLPGELSDGIYILQVNENGKILLNSRVVIKK